MRNHERLEVFNGGVYSVYEVTCYPLAIVLVPSCLMLACDGLQKITPRRVIFWRRNAINHARGFTGLARKKLAFVWLLLRHQTLEKTHLEPGKGTTAKLWSRSKGKSHYTQLQQQAKDTAKQHWLGSTVSHTPSTWINRPNTSQN